MSFPSLAGRLGVGRILVKDEACRLGLPSFKALGASYGVFRLLLEETPSLPHAPSFEEIRAASSREAPRVFCSATDGNHGRALAFSACLFGHRAVIFVPHNTSEARVEAIKKEGAQVVRIEGTYDEAVAEARRFSEAGNHCLVSDTGWDGYLDIPGWIMAGYQTLFIEVLQQLRRTGDGVPDLLLVQAGVGGLAAAAVDFTSSLPVSQRPRIVSVEPLDAACLLPSLEGDGELKESSGDQNSLMAGLNCGFPSAAAWPLLRSNLYAALAIDDDFARIAVCAFRNPEERDPSMISGESGAAGLAGLIALCRAPELEGLRSKVGLGPETRVLLINTEGATDPELYRELTSPASRARWPIPE